MKAEVIDLDTYRKAKGGKKRKPPTHAVPVFSWEKDYRIRLLTQSAVIRAFVVKTLEGLNVNTNDPALADRGKRINIYLNEARMHAERLSTDDLIAAVQDVIKEITTHVPEQNLIQPSSFDEKLHISIYLP